MIADAGEPERVPIQARGSWTHLPTHTSAGIGTEQGYHLWMLRSESELLKVAGQNAPLTVANATPTVQINGSMNGGPSTNGPFVMTEGNQALQLSANAQDPDNDPLTYAWSIVSGTGT